MRDFTFSLLFCFFISLFAIGQVGIGTSAPSPATLLHVDDDAGDKGILIPRVQIDNLNNAAPILTTPEIGTMVFNKAGANPVGFYFWDGSKWIALTASDTDETLYTKNGTLTANRTISMDAKELSFSAGINNGIDRRLKITPPIVTQIDDPFVFDTNNSYDFKTQGNSSLRIDNIGLVGLGTAAPVSKLHISESTGTTGDASKGTITLEHGNSGGASSIVFKSRVNNNSDYGYIRFEDDGSGNGSTSENALLTIGIENDTPGNFQDDINLNPGGYVGIKNNAPKKELHIAGNNSTIRIDGLNTTNNANNIAADPVPVYLNNDGDLVTQPSLVQSFMPLNLDNFLGTGGFIGSTTGAAVMSELNSSTVTLTQPSLVHYTYQFSVTVTRENGTALTDGASRLFRSWFTVNSNNSKRYAFDTGTYTNNPGNGGNPTFASGFYYLSGSGYVQLPAGTHTFKLFGLGFGGSFDFRMTF
jgi:hypothetical protein